MSLYNCRYTQYKNSQKNYNHHWTNKILWKKYKSREKLMFTFMFLVMLLINDWYPITQKAAYLYDYHSTCRFLALRPTSSIHNFRYTYLPQHMGTLSKIKKKKKVKAPIWQYKYSFLCISFFSFLSCKCIILSSNFFSLLKHLWYMVYGLLYPYSILCVFKWFSMRLLKYCKSLKIFFYVRIAHSLGL